MIHLLIHIAFLILYFYNAVSTVYLLVFAVAGRFIKGVEFSQNAYKKRIAVLIPSYKEDLIIVDTTQKAISHDYPREFFDVIVIADSLKKETIEKLSTIPVNILEVEFEISTKGKALHAALQFLQKDQYEIAVVLDADNIMQAQCLEKINDAFQKGCKAAQCHRVAKNQDNPIAFLGAVSEEININLFRRGPAVLGLSAAPLGSGMALEFNLLKDIFDTEKILDNPGEDREIDLQLMRRNLRMEFLNNVYVYDEKVQSAVVFEKQRIRWLEAQFNHARRFFQTDMNDAPKNATYFNKLLQIFLLPRLLYLVIFGAICLIMVLEWFLKTSLLYPSPAWWLACTLIYFSVLLISVPSRFYNSSMLRALVFLPVLAVSMMKAVFKMKRNRKDFLHTQKTLTIK